MPTAPLVAAPPEPAAAPRIVIVEDDELFRGLLKDMVEHRFRPQSCTEFSYGQDALAHCLATPPDLLLADLGLPDLDGRQIIRQLRARGAPTRIVVLTSRVDAVLPAELIALGVAGLVDKAASFEQAVQTVERVLAGGMSYQTRAAPAVSTVSAMPEENGLAPSALDEEERRIAQLVAAGLSSKEIGDRLGLATRTVEKRRSQVMEKIGVRNATGLVRWCIAHGLSNG